MRVVAYSIKSFEKEPLAIANHKKHDITLISNSLSAETVSYAAGKEAVIVFTDDVVSAAVMGKLAALGVKYIATRSTSTLHIDQKAAAKYNMKIANVPANAIVAVSAAELSLALAKETILNLDKWQQNHCLGSACVCSRSCRGADMADVKNLVKQGNVGSETKSKENAGSEAKSTSNATPFSKSADNASAVKDKNTGHGH